MLVGHIVLNCLICFGCFNGLPSVHIGFSHCLLTFPRAFAAISASEAVSRHRSGLVRTARSKAFGTHAIVGQAVKSSQWHDGGSFKLSLWAGETASDGNAVDGHISKGMNARYRRQDRDCQCQ
jgi:hypothetical protein